MNAGGVPGSLPLCLLWVPLPSLPGNEPAWSTQQLLVSSVNLPVAVANKTRPKLQHPKREALPSQVRGPWGHDGPCWAMMGHGTE